MLCIVHFEPATVRGVPLLMEHAGGKYVSQREVYVAVLVNGHLILKRVFRDRDTNVQVGVHACPSNEWYWEWSTSSGRSPRTPAIANQILGKKVNARPSPSQTVFNHTPVPRYTWEWEILSTNLTFQKCCLFKCSFG